MTIVDIGELRTRAEEILRRVHEQGETIDIADTGQVVAQLVPVQSEGKGLSPADAAIMQNLKRLGKELSRQWPADVSAADAVKEQRREL